MTALLIANVGGHLTQLHALRPRLGLGDDVLWVTTDSPQSRSLLAGERVLHLDYPQSRGYVDVARNTVKAIRQVPVKDATIAVSTGANLAVSVLPWLLARGVPVHYIESATRVTGPSASGRFISGLPGVHLYAQYESWAKGRWHFAGTVFDGFAARTGEPVQVKRVVVTLGSSEGYGFRRLLERMVQVLPNDVDVLWQTGVTDTEGLPIDARPAVPARELAEAVRQADVVVAHAGTGSALVALQNGKLPVLVPRRASAGEHVDDHQQQIASMLEQRGLALVREADAITLADLEQAAGASVHDPVDPPLFRLAPPRPRRRLRGRTTAR